MFTVAHDPHTVKLDRPATVRHARSRPVEGRKDEPRTRDRNLLRDYVRVGSDLSSGRSLMEDERARQFKLQMERAARCRKLVYLKKQSAQDAADRMRESRGWDQEPYECPRCRYWHLTSRKEDENNDETTRPVQSRRETKQSRNSYKDAYRSNRQARRIRRNKQLRSDRWDGSSFED